MLLDRVDAAVRTPSRPWRVVLLKPYQEVPGLVASPPLGILYLVSAIREQFGDTVDIQVLDMKSRVLDPEWLEAPLRSYRPDVVGVSALNCEAASSERIAKLVKAIDPATVTVIGGPYPHRRAAELLENTHFDWIFDGMAERTFPEALRRHFNGDPLGDDIPGFSYRTENGPVLSSGTDAVRELDELSFPAWDLVDFDRYANQPTMMGTIKGKRYATIFTSRGCPYKCNYCHDLFGKRFIYRSADRVLAEIELLYEKYGVDEFEIVDDIFNLHKPRLKKIMAEVVRRWPGKLHFCFPNGVRADLIDESVLDALAAGGTYAMAVAIETVTPRLQTLIEKHLDVEHARKVIDWADERGIMVSGFFMIGFPTETPEELRATIDFALQSRLSTAQFFTVTPQPETPLYELARNEGVEALAAIAQDEKEGASYRNTFTWYQRAYGFPLAQLRRQAYREFYFTPRRLWRLWNRVPGWRSVRHGLGALFGNMLGRTQPHALGRPKPPANWPYLSAAASAEARSPAGSNRPM
jgi:radical SAM superfamily enzyme YgiQ (UPF0313 family)